jgi:hypothetical protein
MNEENADRMKSTAVRGTLRRFVQWLDNYGEESWDHQSFFAGGIGGKAKRLYYDWPKVGVLAVAPMIFLEGFLPSGRKWFHQRIRFPIADAHYAMGFSLLYETTGDSAYLSRGIHFLEELKKSRCADYQEFCWGYPFDWVTRNGVIPAGTPLITTTPYVYEAFLQINKCSPAKEWREVMESIARHAAADIKDFQVSGEASSCSYTPYDGGGVVNAAAYRAFLLISAGLVLEHSEFVEKGMRNLRFVINSQSSDGSWPYAVDGIRHFVDHFHTCFVMKALAKIHTLTGDGATLDALRKGAKYYLDNLFAPDGLPKPFAVAPRLTIYKRELYDCAECINLCLLLQDRVPELEPILGKTVNAILDDWVQPSGAFRTRRLHLGWDNVPMHRWGQAQMFASLSRYVREAEQANANVLNDGAANGEPVWVAVR